MKIGYIRGRENGHNYKTQSKFLESSGAEKIYYKQSAGNVELDAMLEYSRSGDIIFIYGIETKMANILAIALYYDYDTNKSYTEQLACNVFNSMDK